MTQELEARLRETIVTVKATVPITVTRKDTILLGTSTMVPGLFIAARNLDELQEGAVKCVEALTQAHIAEPPPSTADTIRSLREQKSLLVEALETAARRFESMACVTRDTIFNGASPKVGAREARAILSRIEAWKGRSTEKTDAIDEA